MIRTYRALGVMTVTFALFLTTHSLSGAESKSIPLDQLGTEATKQVEGDGLGASVSGAASVALSLFA